MSRHPARRLGARAQTQAVAVAAAAVLVAQAAVVSLVVDRLAPQRGAVPRGAAFEWSDGGGALEVAAGRPGEAPAVAVGPVVRRAVSVAERTTPPVAGSTGGDLPPPETTTALSPPQRGAPSAVDGEPPASAGTAPRGGAPREARDLPRSQPQEVTLRTSQRRGQGPKGDGGGRDTARPAAEDSPRYPAGSSDGEPQLRTLSTGDDRTTSADRGGRRKAPADRSKAAAGGEKPPRPEASRGDQGGRHPGGPPPRRTSGADKRGGGRR